MNRLLKLFEVSGIVSEHNKAFFQARLKLTVLYTSILAVILLGVSFIIYIDFYRDFLEEQHHPIGFVSHEMIQGTPGMVFLGICIVDLFILLLVAWLSYVFAGYTLRPMQQAIEAQKKFSENASHEFRTPLAIMRNDIEVLLRNQNATKELMIETMTSNLEEIHRMTRMTNYLLFLVRSEYHGAPEFSTIDATDMTEKIIQKMQTVAMSHGVSLQKDIEKDLFVAGDLSSFERAILNVVKNGIEHTPKEGVVTLKAFKDKGEVVVQVVDTGYGIEKKDLPHLFERFYKGENTSGNGLGLSIVKEIINQHKGIVTIESERGKGTLVEIRVPKEERFLA